MRAGDSALREIDALEQVYAELAAVALRTDDGRRQTLVDLRRRLSAQIAAVGHAAEPLFAATGDAELARRYRTLFSAMRSAAAQHQADWPAVRLGEAPAEHRASVERVRQANRAFFDWTRAAIADLQVR